MALWKLPGMQTEETQRLAGRGAQSLVPCQEKLASIAFGGGRKLQQGLGADPLSLCPVYNGLFAARVDLHLGVPGLSVTSSGEILNGSHHQKHGAEDQHGETNTQEGEQKSNRLSNT